MIGKLLCRIGWHDWGYAPNKKRVSRGLAQQMARGGFPWYQCRRCGERP